MAWNPDYCTATELKSFLRITDAADDTELGFAITAASRAIDLACNRQFGSTTAAARYYESDGLYLADRPALAIDDIQSTTSLAVLIDDNADATFETTLTNDTDFDLFPWNATANGEPWTHMVLRPTASASFPEAARSVKITGVWGWTSVPTAVKQAALLQASRFFARRNAPFGVAGSPELGSELRLLAKVDPDVSVALAPYKRLWAAV